MRYNSIGNRIKNIEFTWDAYSRIDTVKHETFWVTPGRLLFNPTAARKLMTRTSVLRFIFIVPHDINDPEARTSEWIQYWDQLIGDIVLLRPLRKAMTDLEQEERFQIVAAQQRSRLMIEADATYPLLDA